MDYYLQQIIEHEADGIDFVPLFTQKEDIVGTIYMTVTKEELLNGEIHCVPKSNYLFWKMIDGKKVYVG